MHLAWLKWVFLYLLINCEFEPWSSKTLVQNSECFDHDSMKVVWLYFWRPSKWKINQFWKTMQNGNLITQKQPQLKRTLPKFLLQCYFRLTVLQVLNKNVHGKLSNLRMQIKVGRFWNLHSSFSVPEWSTFYFSLLLWITYQAGRALKISIIMMSGEALSWSTIKFSKLIVKKIRSS